MHSRARVGRPALQRLVQPPGRGAQQAAQRLGQGGKARHRRHGRHHAELHAGQLARAGLERAHLANPAGRRGAGDRVVDAQRGHHHVRRRQPPLRGQRAQCRGGLGRGPAGPGDQLPGHRRLQPPGQRLRKPAGQRLVLGAGAHAGPGGIADDQQPQPGRRMAGVIRSDQTESRPARLRQLRHPAPHLPPLPEQQRCEQDPGKRQHRHRVGRPQAKREKSGWRFWKKAWKASCASGLRSRAANSSASVAMTARSCSRCGARIRRLLSRTAPGGS